LKRKRDYLKNKKKLFEQQQSVEKQKLEDQKRLLEQQQLAQKQKLEEEKKPEPKICFIKIGGNSGNVNCKRYRGKNLGQGTNTPGWEVELQIIGTRITGANSQLLRNGFSKTGVDKEYEGTYDPNTKDAMITTTVSNGSILTYKGKIADNGQITTFRFDCIQSGHTAHCNFAGDWGYLLGLTSYRY